MGFLERRRGSVVYLRPAGQARLDHVADLVVGERREFAGQFHPLRPRAGEGDVAAQDVPKLGDLVQMRRAQELAEAGDARVVLLRLGVGAVRAAGHGVHSAELIEHELAVVPPHALLPEDGRPRRSQRY